MIFINCFCVYFLLFSCFLTIIVVKSDDEELPLEFANNLNPSINTNEVQTEQTELEANKPFIEGDHIVNATRGKTISMSCIVHNLRNYKIAWYFNGILLTLNNIRIKDDKRYSVENPQPNEWKLIIDPVDSTNDGQYSCRLTNGLKRTIFLKVGVAPTFIGNNGSHQVIVNANEKQNVTLSCEADGNPAPTIYWYKSGKLIATGPQLFKKDINRHSHSEYECVARNGIEPDPSRLFKINVNFKSSVNIMYHLKEHNKKASSKNTDNLNELSDGELQIVCEVTGNPVNSINWYKDGSKIRDDSKKYLVSRRSNYELYRSTGRSTQSSESKAKKKKSITIHTTPISAHKYISKLKIKNFDNSDNGIYKCLVNGFEGDVSKSITINEITSKLNSENEIEYTFNGIDRNLKLNSNRNDKNSKQIQSENLGSKNAESNYLMHDRARGARYNLTKSSDNIFSVDDLNHSSLNYVFNCKLYLLLILIAINFN